MKKKITHVVLSGGGLFGTCYSGIIYYLHLEKCLDDIKHIAGTSMGAYFGLLLALKIPVEDIEKINKQLIKSFDEKLYINKRSFPNLLCENGVISIKECSDNIIDYFNEKKLPIDITFKDFSKKFGVNLYVSTTRVNDIVNHIFSIETTPDVPVLDAIFASMSVPLLFKPVIINEECYVDGAITNNFPINVFKDIDKNNILAVMLNFRSELTRTEYNKNIENSFIKYMSSIFKLILKNSADQCNHLYLKYDNCLIINDFPIDKMLNIRYEGDNIESILKDDEYDDMFLCGFIAISNYMKE